MDTSEMKLWDLKRIFIGDAPPEFLVEVLIRTIIAYLLLLLAVRFMGKRMAGQMSITDLCVMITLGAIVSPIMQLPDRGILFGALVLVTICWLYWLVNRWSVKKTRFEHITEGKLTCLVKDGIIDVDELHAVGVSHEELFSQLRAHNIENLSQVKRAYLEACGVFSIFKQETKGPGLLVYPENDPNMAQRIASVDGQVQACSQCGHIQSLHNAREKCTVCHSIKWAKAYPVNEEI